MPRKPTTEKRSKIGPLETSSETPEMIASRIPASLNSDPEPIVDPKQKRLSFAVNDDGSIAWDSVRLSRKDALIAELRKAMSDPALGMQEQLPQIEIFDPSWTGTIYDAIGHLESAFAQKAYGIPPDIARSVFVYGDAEKAMLGGPTAKVLNKYASRYNFLVAFKEEIALAMIFFSITAVKFRVANFKADEWRAHEAARARQTRPNGAEVPSNIDTQESTAADPSVSAPLQ